MPAEGIEVARFAALRIQTFMGSGAASLTVSRIFERRRRSPRATGRPRDNVEQLQHTVGLCRRLGVGHKAGGGCPASAAAELAGGHR